MKVAKSIALILLGFSQPGIPSAHAQTKAEIAKVTSITKRVQTNYSALTFLAGLALSDGNYKKAETCYKKILEIFKNDPGVGAKSARYAMILSKMAVCELKLEKRPEALKLSKEALGLVAGMTADNSPDDANYLLLIHENCYLVMGKQMPKPIAPKAPPLVLKPIPVSDIANLRDREKQALRFLYKASKKSRSSEAYMKDLIYLANIYTLEKKYTEAEPLFKKGIDLAERRSGKNSPDLLTPLSNYGYLLLQQGKTTQASAVLNHMQQIRTTSGTESHKSAVKHAGTKAK